MATPPSRWLPDVLADELGLPHQLAMDACSHLERDLFKPTDQKLLRAFEDEMRWAALMRKLAEYIKKTRGSGD
eukprot:5334046-Prymnesium_polylepis.1